jgi:hypothetical protein
MCGNGVADAHLTLPKTLILPWIEGMTTFLLVLGWLVWGFFVLFGLGLLGSRSDVKAMSKIQGFVTLIGCLVTAILPVSKFHLLWWFVVALLTPVVWMQLRANSMKQRIAELQKESEKTGIPFTELLQREMEKIETQEK